MSDQSPTSARVEVTVLFERAGKTSHPIAVTLKRPRSGTRVTVTVEAAVASAKAIYLLSRARADVVLMGSIRRALVETAHRAMGEAASDYRVIKVAVLKEPQ